MPVTPRVSAFSLKTHKSEAVIPAPGAGVDVESRFLFVAPLNIVISKITLVGRAAAVGIAAAPNTSTWVLERRAGAVIVDLAEEVFDDVNVFPDAFIPHVIDVGMGINILPGTIIGLTVTNGGTAAPPETLVQVEYWINEDV